MTVLVNWNGPDDTIECIESLLASDYHDQQIVVVDNGSKDDSLARLTRWAEGRFQLHSNDSRAVGTVNIKPASFVRLPLEEVLSGRGRSVGATVVLVEGKKNHGFAGGVNIGIRCALSNQLVRFVWVLNNDTIVAPDCLSRMVARMATGDSIGMCGSRVLFYWEPQTVQVLGGAKFSFWTGTSRLLGSCQSVSVAVDEREVEREIDHLTGASMLVSREFLEEVGLMEESYFLYYEEADWAVRAKGRYQMVYADDAVVYHKEGASIGSSHQREKRSPLSSFFLVRSRLRFTKKFFPWALPSVFAYSALVAFRAFTEGRREQAQAMFCALRGLSPAEALGWTPD